MKKFFSILALCILTLTSWVSVDAQAQNKIFSKYKHMDDVEYICITKTMLKLFGTGSATINGVHIDGMTNALEVVIIVNSESNKAMDMMKTDFATLSKDESYETLMEINNNGEHVTTLLNSTKPVKEVVMYVDGNDKQVFIVLTGKFTEQQIAKLLNGK